MVCTDKLYTASYKKKSDPIFCFRKRATVLWHRKIQYNTSGNYDTCDVSYLSLLAAQYHTLETTTPVMSATCHYWLHSTTL